MALSGKNGKWQPILRALMPVVLGAILLFLTAGEISSGHARIRIRWHSLTFFNKVVDRAHFPVEFWGVELFYGLLALLLICVGLRWVDNEIKDSKLRKPPHQENKKPE